MAFLLNIVLKGGESGNEASVRLADANVLPAIGDQISVDGMRGTVASRTFHLTPFFTEVEVLVMEESEQ